MDGSIHYQLAAMISINTSLARSSTVRRVAVSLFALPVIAAAHPGHAPAGEAGLSITSAIAAGMAHPISGIDHLLAAVAVGWVCAALGARRALAGAGAFLAALLLGGLAGRAGFVIPGLEAALGISVLALGLLVASGYRPTLAKLLPAIALVGLVHGSAHGSEGPGGATATSFALGFVLATAALTATGASLWMLAARSSWLRRLAGAGLSAAGAIFLWQAAS